MIRARLGIRGAFRRLAVVGLAALLGPAVIAGPTVPDALAGADVAVLGEVHDNPHHHRRQAELVAALAPSAVVFEMLTEDRAATVREVGTTVGPDALGARLGWAASGWPDFAMYFPIIAAADQAGAVVYGAELGRADLRTAVMGGAAESFGADAARFGLDADLPASEQERREALQMAAHCDALPEHLLPGMVSAQRLRDAHLARIALQARNETGGPVVVITGNGHARTDWGVPAMLARAAPTLRVAALGQQEEGAHAPDVPFDLVEITASVDRPDPCRAFTATH